MTPRLALATALVLVSMLPAHAALKGCYERHYDAAHLAKHPGQTAKAVQLQIGFDAVNADSEENESLLGIRFRDRPHIYYARIFCTGSGAQRNCKAEKESETFTLAETPKGLRLALTAPLSVMEEAATNEGEERSVPNDAENAIYALIRVSRGRCQYMR